jgi:hypothetical protein
VIFYSEFTYILGRSEMGWERRIGWARSVYTVHTNRLVSLQRKSILGGPPSHLYSQWITRRGGGGAHQGLASTNDRVPHTTGCCVHI